MRYFVTLIDRSMLDHGIFGDDESPKPGALWEAAACYDVEAEGALHAGDLARTMATAEWDDNAEHEVSSEEFVLRTEDFEVLSIVCLDGSRPLDLSREYHEAKGADWL